MEIKGIIDKIRQNKEEKQEPFFAIQVSDDLIKSALWLIEEGKVKVLAVGENQSWEAPSEILEAVDASLPAGEEEGPQKVIFGVAADWVSENKIIPDKLVLLKKIYTELGLSPLGFVVIPEAIVYYLKTTEGIPPTVILLGLGSQKISVALVKLGRIIGVKTVSRSDNLGADLAEGLSRFSSQESFPPRILLFNANEDLEKEKQELMDYSWDESGINFLHLPKVETLPADFDIRSVALAGGREVGKIKEIEMPLSKTPVAPATEESVSGEPEELPVSAVPIPEETFKTGFVANKDITQETAVPSETKEIKSRRISFPKFKFPPLGKLFSRRIFLVLVIVSALLLILGGVAFSLWWHWPKAELILYIRPQVLEKDFTIKLDPKLSSPSSDGLSLPAQTTRVVLEKEKTQAVTGNKLIGEPAQGEITIYNRTDSEKVLLEGTEISGPGGFKFTLDEKVTVASESAGSDYVMVPGKAKVKVTAVEFGSEGNFASGTEFTIANYAKSDYVGKNEEAFVNGTSREVQAVSENDQDKLTEELVKELKDQATGELSAELTPGQKLIKESITSKIASKNFDKKVGEEAEKLTLKLKVEFSGLSYSEEEFRKLAEKEILKIIPEGFEYKAGETETSFNLKNFTKEGAAVFSAFFKANLFPKLDLPGIRENLSGKQIAMGEAYLGTLSVIESFAYEIKPRFPGKLATFPKVAEKIEIKMEKK
jgi:hypothetical protein